MMYWTLPTELEAQYNRVLEQNRRLQQELGIEPRTIEQRAADYLKKKSEPKPQDIVGKRRPPPKWRV